MLIHRSDCLAVAINFAEQIPRNAQEYQRWLDLKAEMLDSKFRLDGLPELDTYFDSQSKFTITRNPPRDYNCFEIDLDNQVFHGGTMPLFRLKSMPKADLSKMIGLDSFGHLACSFSTPEECRYNWQAPPPHIPQAVIDRYGDKSIEDASVTIHDLLGISETLSAPEAACVYFFQQIVKSAMELRRVGRSIRYLEKVPNRDEIPSSLLSLGRDMVGLSCGPFLYADNGHTHIFPKDEDGFTWFHPQTCLRITTHLDDERSLQAAVADLVRAAMERPHMKGIVYGIGFSFFHCVVVRVDVDDRGSFKHTPALQFLPSFHAESLYTPGITALVRLGQLSEPLDLLSVPPGRPPNGRLLDDLPPELWLHIAHYLFSINDIITLGCISPRSWAAVNSVLRYPHIGDTRIVRLRSMPMSEPLEFEIVHNGESSPYFCILLGGHDNHGRSFDSIGEEGELCLQCVWEDSVCECTKRCRCLEGRPWTVRYGRYCSHIEWD